MDALPSFWTLMPGALIGCLAAGRIGHWIQFLLTVLGRSSARPSLVVGPVQRGPLLLATVAHPVPWLVLIGIGFGVHRLFGPPISVAWIWFFCGFFFGPLILLVLIQFKIAGLRRKRAQGSGRPPPSQ
jgi:hypothetical protein